MAGFPSYIDAYMRSESLSSMRDIVVELVSKAPVGLIVLADLNSTALRTALTGTSSLLDILVPAPGLHRQSEAPNLNRGEYPACAAMTTGYVFRVENPATVLYLQRSGKTGHLTLLSVSSSSTSLSPGFLLANATAVLLTVSVLAYLMLIRDIPALVVVGTFTLVRLINVLVIRQRAIPGWFGAPEPGVKSDLLVLLSQDRWFRIQGLTDDVKAVTSGTWLRDATFIEDSLVEFGTLLLYLAAALSISLTFNGKIALLALLFGNATFLALSNRLTTTLTMFGRTIKRQEPSKPYERRLKLTKELVKEFKRTDCFVAMGMIQPDREAEFQKYYNGAVTM